MDIFKRVMCFGFGIMVAFSLAGCSKEEGPVEQAGKKVDEAVDSVKEHFDNRGPMEKAGAKVDDAVSTIKEKLDNRGPAEKAGEKIDEATNTN